MPALTSMRDLSFEDADRLVDVQGAVFIDLGTPPDYFAGHIPGSIAVLYEAGPGMAARARDCMPLGLPLLLIARAGVDVDHAAASLRGKGFAVLGRVRDALEGWSARHGRPVVTEFVESPGPPGGTLLDVADPGAGHVPGAVRIPADRMWERAHELSDRAPLVVVSGAGVRAAMAVGMLERAGIRNTTVWKPGKPTRR